MAASGSVPLGGTDSASDGGFRAGSVLDDLSVLDDPPMLDDLGDPRRLRSRVAVRAAAARRVRVLLSGRRLCRMNRAGTYAGSGEHGKSLRAFRGRWTVAGAPPLPPWPALIPGVPREL